MAYSTSTATSPDGLLSAIYTFATANGWTGQTNTGTGGDPANSQRVLDDGAGGVFAMIPQNALGEIHFQPAAVYNSGATFVNHLGTPDNLGTAGTFCKVGNIPNGSSFTYHLFLPNAAPRYIHVVVRKASGVFTHMAIGTCKKFGTFTGGQYASGMSYRSNNAANAAIFFCDAINTSHATQRVRCDAAFSTNPGSASISSANTSTDVITTSATHNLQTQTPVYLTGGSLPTGLNTTTVYYVRSESATTLTLYDTAAHANAGGATGRADITATGTGTINAPGWAEKPGLVPTTGLGGTATNLMKMIFHGGLMQLNQRTPFCPNYLKYELTGGTPGNLVYVGETPDLRISSMEGRNPDGETVTIGSDDWLIFPCSEVGSTPDTGASAYIFTGTQPNHKSNFLGYAYRKIT